MRVRYETGVATLVQFIAGIALSIVGAVDSIISSCRNHPATDCVSNTLVSLVLIILTVGLLGALLALGYSAQERRSTRLALILIGSESVAAIIYAFDAKQSPDLIDRAVNIIGASIVVWVIVVAARLALSRGRRIVSGGRKLKG